MSKAYLGSGVFINDSPDLTSWCGMDNFGRMLIGSENPQQFIKLMRENYRRGCKAISLNKWSQRLGYKSTRSLGMLMEGKRLPSTKMIESLAKDFGLTTTEKRYLELLVLEKQGGKSNDLKLKIQTELEQIRQRRLNETRQLSNKEFGELYHWYVFVIRQLVGLNSFQENMSWIKKKLRNKVSETQIKETIELLLQVGGLSRDPSTAKLTKTNLSILSKMDIPNNAIRKHHVGMLDRAKESLDEMGVHEREFNSLVMSIDKTKLPMLKRQIKEFCSTFNNEHSNTDANSVFQLNVHFFEHTIDIDKGTDCAD